MMPVLLFLLLGGICIYCIYKTDGYRQWALNSLIREVTYPVLKLQMEWEEWIRIGDENQRLLSQNRNLLMLAFNHKREFNPIENIYYGDSLLFSYHPAKAIETTINKQNNYVVLDKGYADGIRTNMGVISSEGVVGIIKEVSPNFSIALSLLHSQFNIFARVKNTDVSGILTWNGINIQYAQMNNLAHIENVKVSDTVITQHSLVFPPGYPIGIVTSIYPKTTGGYFVLNIKLLTPFEKLGNVYIIEQNYSEELNNLMERIHTNE
ncbi:MAG: rod shape-determining protein MreC [Bacteroidales bacterium]|jgi:rod shape-determining protein MreC|nr:rod shape-determining protein MreC [Bacteroidales bacterium]